MSNIQASMARGEMMSTKETELSVQNNCERDSYNKVRYINNHYDNTGNVGQLTYGKDNKELDESLQKTSDLLDGLYKKYQVEEKIVSRKF